MMLKNKLQSHMYRRNTKPHQSRKQFSQQQKSLEEIKKVQIIVEDVEKKIEKMQAHHPDASQLRGISTTKAPSLDMIRHEVQVALSKVSSSVDLSLKKPEGQEETAGNLQGKQQGPTKSRQSLILRQNNGQISELRSSDELINTVVQHQSSSHEELQAIEHLKKARQLRRL